jgi:protein arginine N-methyltransferase 2
MLSNKSYFQQNLKYTEDLLLDEEGKFIMMEWERPIMKQAAKDICKNGGDVLNVGFGMGIIDSYIEQYSIKTHWIIEAHPEVQKKILDKGWGEKKHVKLIFQPWQEVLNKLPKFDGIYFDTWDEDQNPFNEYISYILKPKGVYSFFNNPTAHSEEFNYPYLPLQDYIQSPVNEFYEKGPIAKEKFSQFDINFTPIKVDPPENNGYFNPKKKIYWHPLLTFK